MPQEFCYHCMTPTVVGGRCTVCGRAPSQCAQDDGILPVDTRLAGGRVIIGEKLGRGGFGVTYVGLDTKTGQRVAVKEFMPRYLVRREGNILCVDDDKRESFDKVLRSFHKEAKTIHLLDAHPNIVRVLTLFSENGTAYYTMEMLKGLDLHKYIKALGRPLTPVEAYHLLDPIMRALTYVHQKQVLHRDISPDNILLCLEPGDVARIKPTDIRTVKLIDFGAAHVAVESFTQSFPEVRKNGYSPLEQNWAGDKQGPWTDEYALAATFYMALTGRNPISANDRTQSDDPLPKPSQLAPHIPAGLDAVILKGMALSPKARYPDIQTFRRELYKAIFNKPLSEPSEETGDLTPPPVPKPELKPTPPEKKPNLVETEPEAKTVAEKHTSIRALLAILLEQLVFCTLPSALFGLSGLCVGWLLMVVVNFGLVYVPPHGSSGERLMGLRVSDTDENRLTVGQCVIRTLLRGVLGMPVMEAFAAVFTPYQPLFERSSHTVTEMASNAGHRPSRAHRGQEHSASEESCPPKGYPLPPQATPLLTMLCSAGSLTGKVTVYREPILLGRDPKRANLLIPAEDRLVSGLHARITFDNGKYRLRDEHSSNGTKVNGTRVDPDGETVALQSGDVLELGNEKFEISMLYAREEYS